LKKTLISSLILVLLLTVVSLAFSPSNADQTSPVVDVQSSIEIKEGGIVLVNETLTLLNPKDTSKIQDLFVGFPSPFADFLDYHAFYQSTNGTWITLTSKYEEVLNGTIEGFRVTLLNPVDLSASQNLSLRAIFLFSKMVSPFGQELAAGFPLYPSVPLTISTFTVEAKLPKGGVLSSASPLIFSNSTVDGTYVLNHAATSLTPYQNRTAVVSYTPGGSSNIILECQSAQRTIDLSSSEIIIQDAYTLVDLGPTLYYYSLQIPSDAFEIKAEDALSLLTIYTEKNETWDYTIVHVKPKTYVQTSERWTFSLQYSLPYRNYVKTADNISLSYSMRSNVSFTIRNLSMRIILPEGGEYLSSTPQAYDVKKTGMFAQEIYFARNNATFLDDPQLQVTYKYNPVWKAFRPTIWSSCIVLAVVATYGLLRFRRKPEEAAISEDQALLQRFIDLYEERLTLSADQEKLEDDVENKRIGRSEYNRRIEDIRTRSSRTMVQLNGMKDRIKQKMPQYEAMLKETEVAEVEIETERTNLRELGGRLRNRRISRDAYLRLRGEYAKRIDRARSRIERAILSLREKAY